MADKLKIKGRIKPGSSLMHDHSFHRWPDCSDGTVDANLIFECTLNIRGADGEGTFWDCRRPGFGILGGDYGNGSLLVSGLSSVEPARTVPS